MLYYRQICVILNFFKHQNLLNETTWDKISLHNVIILFTFVASNQKITTIMNFSKISLALVLLGMSMIVHAEEKKQ